MTGKRSRPFHDGDRYEYFVTFILSSIASIIPVPRTEDYGIDHLGFLTKEDQGILYTEEAFGLQIKAISQTNTLLYIDNQIDWLFGQNYPLLMGFVDPVKWILKLYTTSPMWYVRFKAGFPPKLKFELNINSGKIDRLKEPTQVNNTWIIQLGPPIISLDAFNLQEITFRKKIYDILKYWLVLDYRNIRHKAQNIPFSEEVMGWETNEIPISHSIAGWWFFNETIGFNQNEILTTVMPMIIGLALNMEVQQDKDIIHLKEILKYFNNKGMLNHTLQERFKNIIV